MKANLSLPRIACDCQLNPTMDMVKVIRILVQFILSGLFLLQMQVDEKDSHVCIIPFFYLFVNI